MITGKRDTLCSLSYISSCKNLICSDHCPSQQTSKTHLSTCLLLSLFCLSWHQVILRVLKIKHMLNCFVGLQPKLSINPIAWFPLITAVLKFLLYNRFNINALCLSGVPLDLHAVLVCLGILAAIGEYERFNMIFKNLILVTFGRRWMKCILFGKFKGTKWNESVEHFKGPDREQEANEQMPMETSSLETEAKQHSAWYAASYFCRNNNWCLIIFWFYCIHSARTPG